MTTVVEYYISEKERKNTVKLFCKYFDKKDSAKIEEGLYCFTEQYCRSTGFNLNLEDNLKIYLSVYKDCTRNLLYNLEQDSSTIQDIKKRIIEKRFNPYNLAFLRPEELNEDNWTKIIMRKKTTEETFKNLPTVEWKPCRACKNTKFFYKQEQTRSADEPMTIFYTCKQCGKVTKINN